MEISALYQLYQQSYSVTTDTRKIVPNSLFFALKGDNFNGNTFAQEALEKGASYAIVDEAISTHSKKIIRVNDVLTTLQQLANYHRNQLTIPVIGLTGSNGKTTTKELIHAVLSKKYTTWATQGNLNNHIGVPLSLLAITPKYEIAVIEMGANHQKEIEFLSNLCEPDYGYITNFGKAHLEGFGGVKGVIKGKSELYSYLKEHNKTAFVNPNDSIQLKKTTSIKRIKLNFSDIRLVNSNPSLSLQYKEILFKTQLIGDYNFSNIVAAITIGEHFNVPKEDIIVAIGSYVSENNRSQQLIKEDYQITLDAYNANPSSMKVALESFATSTTQVKTVILGDMFELGDESEKEHQFIATLVNELSIDHCYLIGKHFYDVFSKGYRFKNFDDFEAFLKTKQIPKGAILIKGSRGMQLERVLELL